MNTPRSRTIALLVAGTFFMENLDGTIVTTATPAIGASLGVAPSAVGITITAYLLTLAVLIPLSGWITGRFGARRVFLLAIAIFTIASVLCALSGDLLSLTAFRVLQAAGGAMMVPVGRLVVLRTTDRADMLRTIALLTWPALVAPVIAPLAGGVIVTFATWHWIFLINAPLGVIAFVAALRLMPADETRSDARLDWRGLALVSSGLGLVVFSSSVVASDSPDWMLSLTTAVLGIVLVVFAVRHLVRAAHPLLHLAVLRIPTFRLSHAGGSVFRVTVNAVPFLLPLMFQVRFGESPIYSGTMVLLLFVGNVAIKPATTGLIRRFGFRSVLIAATSGASLTMALTATLDAATPLLLLVPLMIASGVVRSVGFTAYNSLAFADVPQTQMTEANTLSSTVQQLAIGFGVALGALALQLGAVVSTAASRGVAADGFRFAFVLIAVVTLFPVVEACLSDRASGDSIRPVRAVRA